ITVAATGSTGVMLYNAGSNFPGAGGTGTPTYGGLTLSGNGTFNLTPLTSGPYAGLLIVQPGENPRALSLSGNALALRGGAVYAPAALLAASGNGTLQASLVVDKLLVSGNAATTLHADGTGTDGGAAGQLLAGDLVVYVDNTSGNFTPDELARIGDAIDAINLVVSPLGVAIAETADRSEATTVLQPSAGSAVGGA